MMKKIKRIVCGIILCTFFIGLNVKVSNAERRQFNIEQAMGEPPEITAYVNGERTLANAEYIASFKENNKKFKTKSIKQFKASGKSVRYIVFLDDSKSVSEAQFNQAKEQLVQMRKKLRSKDEMELYTVGSNSKRGNKSEVFKTNGKNENKINKNIESITNIRRNKAYTVLYRSLTKELITIDNSSKRTIILLITDGEDDSAGKDKENYNVNPAVEHSNVPIYGILLKNVSLNPKLKTINNTKKKILNESISRGYCRDCANKDDVRKGFNKIFQIIFDETYVVKFRACDGSNKTLSKADSKLSIILKRNNKTYEALLDKEGQFAYINSIKDTDRPKIISVSKNGDNSIKVKIKDGTTKRLIGANDRSSYIIRSDDNSSKIWEISSVSINEDDNIYTLIFKDKFYTGKYTIECKNITDDSIQQNRISSNIIKFEIKGGLNKTFENFKSAFNTYCGIAVIVIVIIIGVLIMILIKRKLYKAEVKVDDIVGADSKLVQLSVKDKNGNVSNLEINIAGSFFVGRSEICNLYFDDDSLSKQHFVIEVTKMACYIEDLETTNSTFVNGVKITGRRILSDGDIISAGREQFVFHSAISEVEDSDKRK